VSVGFGVIRSAAQAPPSKEAWEYVCQLVDSVREPGELERAMGYLESSLRDWPVALRQPPKHWRRKIMSGDASPRYRLIRTMLLSSTTQRYVERAVATGLPGAARVEHLDVQGESFDPAGLVVLLDSACFPALEGLRFDRFAWGTSRAWRGFGKALAARPRLTRVHLSDSHHLATQCVKALGGHAHGLTSITIEGSAFDGQQVANLARVLDAPTSQITALGLPNNRCGSEGWRALAGPGLARLESLDLSSTLGDAAAARALTARPLPNLRHLDVRHNALGGEGIAALLEATSGLESLGVDLYGDTDDVAAALARPGALASLRRLTVQFTSGGQRRLVEALAVAGAFEGLEHLSVRNLSQRGAKVLLAQDLGQLTTLELDAGHTRTDTWDAAAQNASLDRLESLRLNDCAWVEGEGWARFCGGAGFAGLTRLELEGCGGDPLERLAGSDRVSSLARLSLRRVPSDGAALARLFADPRVARLEAIELEMDRLPTPEEAAALVGAEHTPRFWRVPKSARKVARRG
jgi:hypothetical protein